MFPTAATNWQCLVPTATTGWHMCNARKKSMFNPEVSHKRTPIIT